MAGVRLELWTFNETRLIEAGETALKERRYDAAVQVFDHARTRLKTKDASNLRAKTMLLLDLLVEARIGLARFDRALKDAGTMVRCDRTDARGYIRCGQLKRLQGSRQAALDFYTKGLQNVPTDQKLYQVLRTQHDQTARARVTLSLPADPIQILPAEILRMILSHFTYRDATLLLRVSKTWSKTIVASHQTIMNSIDFSQSKRSISRPAFLACLRRLSQSPSVLDAQSLSRGATRALFDRLWSWALLTTLKLRKVNLDVKFVRWSKLKLREVVLGEEQRVTTAIVWKILRVCPRLKIACFLSVKNGASIQDLLELDEQVAFPSLEKFTLSGTSAPTMTVAGQLTALQWPAAFVQRLSNIEELTFFQLSLTGSLQSVLDFSGLAKLRSLIMSTVRLNNFPTMPQSLEVLRCADIRSLPGLVQSWHAGFPSTSTEVEMLANLRTVQFHQVNDRATKILERLPVSPDRSFLTYLDLSESSLDTSRLLQLLEAGKFREVKHLRLSYPSFGDDFLETMMRHCPNLEMLHLVDSKVTGVFVKGLVDALGNQLKRICLEGLEPKVSFDAVKWAQEKGVTMVWRYNTYPGFCEA